MASVSRFVCEDCVHSVLFREVNMKGLAIYSLIVVCWSLVACFVGAVVGDSVSANIYAIAMFIPVALFIGLYLKND